MEVFLIAGPTSLADPDCWSMNGYSEWWRPRGWINNSNSITSKSLLTLWTSCSYSSLSSSQVQPLDPVNHSHLRLLSSTLGSLIWVLPPAPFSDPQCEDSGVTIVMHSWWAVVHRIPRKSPHCETQEQQFWSRCAGRSNESLLRKRSAVSVDKAIPSPMVGPISTHHDVKHATARSHQKQGPEEREAFQDKGKLRQ